MGLLAEDMDNSDEYRVDRFVLFQQAHPREIFARTEIRAVSAVSRETP